MAPSARTSLPAFISSQVRLITRPTPVWPTNMWWASSVSMKRQVRARGSKPLSARASSWNLPSRVREHREAEEGQPLGAGLVEGAQDARVVRVAGAALQQLLGLLATVAAEVAVEQVHHRPQVPALLDVDLEQVAHVVQGGGRVAEQALLLDRGRLGVRLGHDQAPQPVAVLAGDLLPGQLAEVVAEGDRAALLLRLEEDAPAVVGHLDVVEVGPAVLLHADRRAQVHVVGVEVGGADRTPPLQVVGLPGLEGALQALVGGQIDVVGDLGAVVDSGHGFLAGDQVRATLNSGRLGVP